MGQQKQTTNICSRFFLILSLLSLSKSMKVIKKRFFFCAVSDCRIRQKKSPTKNVGDFLKVVFFYDSNANRATIKPIIATANETIAIIVTGSIFIYLFVGFSENDSQLLSFCVSVCFLKQYAWLVLDFIPSVIRTEKLKCLQL